MPCHQITKLILSHSTSHYLQPQAPIGIPKYQLLVYPVCNPLQLKDTQPHPMPSNAKVVPYELYCGSDLYTLREIMRNGRNIHANESTSVLV